MGPQDLLLMPLHIVLLEFVMDPTVSIALERQPAEPDIMRRPPRNPTRKLITLFAFVKSMLQGIAIFCASFFLYYGLMNQGYSAEMARTCGFTVLVLSSMLLVLINCSEHESVFRTIYRLRFDTGVWLLNLVILSGLLGLIYSPLHSRLGFEPLDRNLLLLTVILSFASVLWYEPVKMIVKHFHKKGSKA
jgi:Ca2+-transporting ATPase